MTWQQEVNDLASLLKSHSATRAFQEVKERFEQLSELQSQARVMKDYQQDAVFFNQIEKRNAYDLADQKAGRLQEDLNQLPIVIEYRAKMQDASDLLFYVTKGIEEGINKEIEHD